MTASSLQNPLATYVRMGNYTASTEVMGALRSASGGSQTNFALLASKAALESGFRPDAQAGTSSARGLFQFTEQTWLSMLREHGAKYGAGAEAGQIVSSNGRLTVQDPALRTRILAMRDNPTLSANMTVEYMREVSAGLTPVLGRNPDAAELYLGHFLGAGGATRMVQAQANNPNQPAANVLPAAAAANPTMFNNGDGTPMTVSQFMNNIRNKVNRTYASLGIAAPSGPVDLGSTDASATRTGPGEAGGWGNGTPARLQLNAERVMVANLSRVFAKLGKNQPGARQPSTQEIPAAVLAPLRDAPAANTTTTLTSSI